MIRTIPYLLLMVGIALPVPAKETGTDVDTVHVGLFSKTDLSDITPPGWYALEFPSIENKTAYFLTRQQDTTVVQAVSHASASAYFKEVDISPRHLPILKWRWKIENVLHKSNIMSKQGDDYPARIYVSFEYDPQRLSGMERVKYKLYNLTHDRPAPLAVINYVWGNGTAIDTIVSNAYSDRVKMIVVQNDAALSKRWLTQQRNIYQDYIKAFGEEPGRITGIAIMTDTDNTGESVTAYYGDISFSPSAKQVD